ncbi:MAG: phage holin family protein [Firmicutes bacterium]|nr:phage holin family protein [Bacillota bacterium]
MRDNRRGGTGLPGWIAKWMINALAILIISYVPYGAGQLVEIEGWGAALIAPLLLGIVNAFIRPILVILSLPVEVLTLGLFTLVINAFMLMLVSWLMGPHFDIPGFWAAVLASILLSLISGVLNALVRGDRD